MAKVFIGHDWAEDPHDVLIEDGDGRRLGGHNHRPVAGDSELGDAVKMLARAHQNLIWTRQRQVNQLRSTLREFYPAALEAFDDLAHRDALAVLAVAPTPHLGRQMSRSKIAAALRRGGRQRRIDERAEQIQTALRADHLTAPDVVADAMGAIVASQVAVTATLVAQIDQLETDLADRFDQHPDATKHSEPSPTASSASSTAASTTEPTTTKTPPGHTAPSKPLDAFHPWGVYRGSANTPAWRAVSAVGPGAATETWCAARSRDLPFGTQPVGVVGGLLRRRRHLRAVVRTAALPAEPVLRGQAVGSCRT